MAFWQLIQKLNDLSKHTLVSARFYKNIPKSVKKMGKSPPVPRNPTPATAPAFFGTCVELVEEVEVPVVPFEIGVVVIPDEVSGEVSDEVVAAAPAVREQPPGEQDSPDGQKAKDKER